ncbi:hypothetical protein ACH5RR_010255 [Cinchona calisaya]|uniref:Uncharacterized protein n=1 Tax=Cinchona calisaya TaxID=153742 RepID=A0ABD3AHR0_9GENT
MQEIVAGVLDSDVRFLWIAREDASRLQEGEGSKGLVVPWCDQLKVLCHPSIGGLWSYCEWNSTKEGAFAGVLMLTFPLKWDQFPNSKHIVENWKMGWTVRRNEEILVTREEISDVLKRFMDLGCDEGKEMRRRTQEIREICRLATVEGGSSQLQIKAFINDITKLHNVRT